MAALALILFNGFGLGLEAVGADYHREHLKTQETLLMKGTTENRTFAHYEGLLTPAFREKMQTLDRNSLWVDLGAGEAVALKEYSTGQEHQSKTKGISKGVAHRARVMAIGMIPPKPHWSQAIEEKLKSRKESGHYTELYGRWFHEIQDLPRADVITDLFGVLTYEHPEHLEKTLTRVLELLKPQGELHLMNGAQSWSFAKGSDENWDLIRRFFGSIQGVELIAEKEVRFQGAFSIALRRTQGPIKVPSLRVKSYFTGTPPQRKLQADDCQPLLQALRFLK